MMTLRGISNHELIIQSLFEQVLNEETSTSEAN